MTNARVQKRAMRCWIVASTLLLLLALLMLLHAPPAQAQGGVLTEGVPSVGALSPEAPGAFYTFISTPGALVTIQVVGLTDGMNPSLTLLSPLQQPVASSSADPLGLGNDARLTYLIRDAGPHFVLLAGTPGNYMVRYSSLLPEVVTPLAPGIPAPGQIAQGLTLAYSFTADAGQTLSLAISSPDPNLTFVARVYGEEGELAAVLAGSGSTASGLIIPAGSETYYVIVTSLADPPGNLITVQITPAGVASVPGGEPPVVSPPVVAPPVVGAPGDVCVASALQAATAINIRFGPGINYQVVSQIPIGGTLPIVGRDFSGQWYAGRLPNGAQGWVSGAVVVLSGPCGQLPLLAAPPLPSTGTPTTTVTYTPTGSVTPTATPTATATYTPSATATGLLPTLTSTPTSTPTATATGVLPPPPTLTPTPTSTSTSTATHTPTNPPPPTSTPTNTPPPTATFTPTAPVPTAPPDPNFNAPLNIPLDSTASSTDFVSFPDGDTIDQVRYDITGMNQNPSISGGRARLIITASCFGTGTANIRFSTGGQTFNCGQTIVDREVTFDSRTGTVVIEAIDGTATYVQWVLTGTATRVN